MQAGSNPARPDRPYRHRLDTLVPLAYKAPVLLPVLLWRG
jgi:hypothetical protein